MRLAKLNISQSGTAASPVTIDGQGEVIDLGVQLTDWEKVTEGVWQSRAIEPQLGRYPGYLRINGKVTRIQEVFDGVLGYKDGRILIGSFTHPLETREIIMPWSLYGILTTGKYINIRGFIIKDAAVGGCRSIGARGVHYEDTVIDTTGGAISSIDTKIHPRAGNGISYDGSTYDCSITNSHIENAFDAGMSVQLFKAEKQYGNNVHFENNTITRCGSACSFSVHKDSGSLMKDMYFTDNVCTDLGYGWSGYIDNAAHGKGVGVKALGNSMVQAFSERNKFNRYAWCTHKVWGGILEEYDNMQYGYTGDYKRYLDEHN